MNISKKYIPQTSDEKDNRRPGWGCGVGKESDNFGFKDVIKVGTYRIVEGEHQVSSVLDWLWGRAGEVKRSPLCGSSVITKRRQVRLCLGQGLP